MASKLTNFQKQMCFEVINGILKYKISFLFDKPVDPQLDNCPDYFDIIKKPMDLQTVRKKLSSNEYSTIRDWKRDMSLIWENALVYNPSETIIYDCASHLKAVYERLSKKLSDDPEADWLREFESIDNGIHKIRKNFKRHFNIPDDNRPKEKPQTYNPPKETKEIKQEVNKSKSKPKDDYQEKPPRQEPRREQSQQKHSSSSSSKREEVPPPKVKKETPTPTPTPPPAPTPPKPAVISKAILQEIYQKFNEAAENDEMLYDDAINIIHRGEGLNEDEDVEINIDSLRQTTLKDLANLFHISLQ